MSAEVLREAAQAMREHGGLNLCDCGDDACHDNWYARWVLAVADWLDAEAKDAEGAARLAAAIDYPGTDFADDNALAVARAYLAAS